MDRRRNREDRDERDDRDDREGRDERATRPERARGDGRNSRDERGGREERPRREERRPPVRTEGRDERPRREDRDDDGPDGFPEKRIIDTIVRAVTERVVAAMQREFDLRGLTVQKPVDVTPKGAETKENKPDPETPPTVTPPPGDAGT